MLLLRIVRFTGGLIAPQQHLLKTHLWVEALVLPCSQQQSGCKSNIAGAVGLYTPSSKPEKPPVKLPGAEGIPPGPVALIERELPPSPLTLPFPASDSPLMQVFTPGPYVWARLYPASSHSAGACMQ